LASELGTESGGSNLTNRKRADRLLFAMLNHRGMSRVIYAFQFITLDLGLSSRGTLSQWVQEYIAGGYNVIEKKKGRKIYGKEETGGSSAEERNTAERKCGSSQAERDPYDTKRILKKLNGLVTEKENQEKKKSREQ
jgi:hypothetical protein